jgi:hypothetical protein
MEALVHLNLIRNVRNRFAHSFDALTFDHPEIASLIRAAHRDITRSMREEFVASFQAISTMILVVMFHNIRLKSLEESHGAWTKSMTSEEMAQFAEALEERWRDTPLPAWLRAFQQQK